VILEPTDEFGDVGFWSSFWAATVGNKLLGTNDENLGEELGIGSMEFADVLYNSVEENLGLDGIGLLASGSSSLR
jgi:hypothetical protein